MRVDCRFKMHLSFPLFKVDLNTRPSNQSVMGGVPVPHQGSALIDEDGSLQAKLQSLHRVNV